MHFYPHGVQGVASSNPAAPTNGIKQSGHSSEWPFCLHVPKVISGYRMVTVGGPSKFKVVFLVDRNIRSRMTIPAAVSCESIFWRLKR